MEIWTKYQAKRGQGAPLAPRPADEEAVIHSNSSSVTRRDASHSLLPQTSLSSLFTNAANSAMTSLNAITDPGGGSHSASQKLKRIASADPVLKANGGEQKDHGEGGVGEGVEEGAVVKKKRKPKRTSLTLKQGQISRATQDASAAATAPVATPTSIFSPTSQPTTPAGPGTVPPTPVAASAAVQASIPLAPAMNGSAATVASSASSAPSSSTPLPSPAPSPMSTTRSSLSDENKEKERERVRIKGRASTGASDSSRPPRPDDPPLSTRSQRGRMSEGGEFKVGDERSSTGSSTTTSSTIIPVASVAPLNYSPPSPSHYLLTAHPSSSSSEFSNRFQSNHQLPTSSSSSSPSPLTTSTSMEDLNRVHSQLAALKSDCDGLRKENKELRRDLTLTRSQLRDSESESKISSLQLTTELTTLRALLVERDREVKEDERRLREMGDQLVKAQTAAEHEITFFNLEVEKEIARSKQERELQKMKVEAQKTRRQVDALQADLRKLREAAKAGNYTGVDLSDDRAREELKEAKAESKRLRKQLMAVRELDDEWKKKWTENEAKWKAQLAQQPTTATVVSATQASAPPVADGRLQELMAQVKQLETRLKDHERDYTALQIAHTQLQASNTALLSSTLKGDDSVGSQGQTQTEALQTQLFSATQQLFEVKGLLDKERGLLEEERKKRDVEVARVKDEGGEKAKEWQRRFDELKVQLEGELEEKETKLEKAHFKYNDLLATKNGELMEKDRSLDAKSKELIKQTEAADHRHMLLEQEMRDRMADLQRAEEEKEEKTRALTDLTAQLTDLHAQLQTSQAQWTADRERWQQKEAELTAALEVKAKEYAELDEQSMKAYTELQAESEALERRLEKLIEEKMAEAQRWRDERDGLLHSHADALAKADERYAKLQAEDERRLADLRHSTEQQLSSEKQRYTTLLSEYEETRKSHDAALTSLQGQLQASRDERAAYEASTSKQTLVLEKRIAKLTGERDRLHEAVQAKTTAMAEYHDHLEELQRERLAKETETHKGTAASLFHKLVSRTREPTAEQRATDEDIVVALSRRLERVEGERLEMKERLEKLGVHIDSVSAPGSRSGSGRASRSNSAVFSSTQPVVANHNVVLGPGAAASVAGALPAPGGGGRELDDAVQEEGQCAVNADGDTAGTGPADAQHGTGAVGRVLDAGAGGGGEGAGNGRRRGSRDAGQG